MSRPVRSSSARPPRRPDARRADPRRPDAGRAEPRRARPPRTTAAAWQHPQARGGDLIYREGFLDREAKTHLLHELGGLHPIWESRYGEHQVIGGDKPKRRLLRPVYWLGTWQFACLGYYEPPRHTVGTVVEAEPFPPLVRALARRIERLVAAEVSPALVPPGWHLSTCLVNLYGSALEDGRWRDAARVGEHRDFEPGPVASISLGERALFQFVGRGAKGAVEKSQWLDDCSLMVFAGPRWKTDLLHRVPRVDNKLGQTLGPTVDGFRTRRLNLTFRYVPAEHVVQARQLPAAAKRDIEGYLTTLAAHSAFFKAVRATL